MGFREQSFSTVQGFYTVENIAALATLSTCCPIVRVLCYSSPGDNGGGDFVWFKNDMTPDNRGTIIASKVLNGRWKRIYVGPVHTEWFGVKADKTDSTVALQAAIDASASIEIQSGQIYIAGTLKIKKKVSIKGNDTELFLAPFSNCSMIQVVSEKKKRNTFSLSDISLNGNAVNQTKASECVQIEETSRGSILRNVTITNNLGLALAIRKSSIALENVQVNKIVCPNYVIEINGDEHKQSSVVLKDVSIESASLEKDRGAGVLLSNLGNVNIDNFYCEGFINGLAIQNCLNIEAGLIRGSFLGNSTKPNQALVSILDNKIRRLSIALMQIVKCEQDFSFVKKAQGVQSPFLLDVPAVNFEENCFGPYQSLEDLQTGNQVKKTPNKSAKFIGETWVDTSVSPPHTYVAISVGKGEEDWSPTKASAQYANGAPCRHAKFLGEVWCDGSTNPVQIHLAVKTNASKIRDDWVQIYPLCQNYQGPPNRGARYIGELWINELVPQAFIGVKVSGMPTDFIPISLSK